MSFRYGATRLPINYTSCAPINIVLPPLSLLLLLSWKAITRFANIFYLSQVIHRRSRRRPCHCGRVPYLPSLRVNRRPIYVGICTASEFSFTPPPTQPSIHPSPPSPVQQEGQFVLCHYHLQEEQQQNPRLTERCIC